MHSAVILIWGSLTPFFEGAVNNRWSAGAGVIPSDCIAAWWKANFRKNWKKYGGQQTHNSDWRVLGKGGHSDIAVERARAHEYEYT